MAPKGHDTAVETLAKHTEMTEREAEAYVWRELRNVRRAETARQMDVSENTLDNHLQAARRKAALPNISQVKRVSAKKTNPGYGTAWEIWYPNDASVRYIWDDELEQIREETRTAVDPDTVHESVGVGGDENEVGEFALEFLEVYTRDYRDDLDVARQDLPHVVEAILLWN